jgi:hypothetical protein
VYGEYALTALGKLFTTAHLAEDCYRRDPCLTVVKSREVRLSECGSPVFGTTVSRPMRRLVNRTRLASSKCSLLNIFEIVSPCYHLRMPERRKDLLTRSIVNDMMDGFRSGIHVTSEEGHAFLPSINPAIAFVDLPHSEYLEAARKIALFRLNALMKEA